jgi:hypothetical protein
VSHTHSHSHTTTTTTTHNNTNDRTTHTLQCFDKTFHRTKKCASFTSEDDCLAKLADHIRHSGKHSEAGDRTHQDIEDQIAEGSQMIVSELVDASWFIDHLCHPIVHPRIAHTHTDTDTDTHTD